MERPSQSVADWMASFETMLLELNSGRFLDFFDSESIVRLEKALSSVLLSVRTCHNARQPINRLPPELFADIFRHVQEGSQPTFPNPKFHKDVRCARSPQANIISVCRHWRDMMLPQRGFWSTIIIPYYWLNDVYVRYIKHYLKHSGSTPLNIYANTLDRYSLRPIAKQSSRLRVLNLRFLGSYHAADALRDFTGPAPILECLHIHTDIDRRYSEADLPLLFTAQTPSLRQLCLCGIPSWGENNFTTLTHLSIDAPTSSWPDHNALERLLTLLQANPSLEELNLFRIGGSFLHDSAEDGGGHPLPLVNLGQLQRLSINSCAPHEAADLLAHLKLPSGASISLSVNSSLHRHDLFSVLPNDISNLQNFLQITTLTIRCVPSASSVIAIGGGPSCGLYLKHLVDNDLTPDPDDEGDVVEQDCARFFHKSVEALVPLPFVGQLKELWLTGEYGETHDETAGIQLETCQRLFRQATSLVKICFSGGYLWNALEALDPGDPEGTPAVHSQDLHTLIIDESAIYPRDALLACVKRRAELGYPIHRVSIYLVHDGTPGLVEYLEDLRRYVNIVDSHQEELPEMEIPASWGARRHVYWPEWNLEGNFDSE